MPGPSRLALALLGALAPTLTLAPRPAAAGPAEERACTEAFERVQRALESRSAPALVACMAPQGTLTVSLLGLPAKAEPMKREQALRVLASYFEQVGAASLKVREGQAPDGLVRAYDYTRRLKAGDPATTRLTITLRRDAAGALALHSLVESAR